MYWKFDKEFELLPSLPTYGASPPKRSARMHDVIPRAVYFVREGGGGGGSAIFHSGEIKLSRSTAGNYDTAVRLTRSRDGVSHFFPRLVRFSKSSTFRNWL